MLSIGSDRPVDPMTVAVARAIDEVARALDLPYFLAGAMARDILLTHVYGININRATADVDFGVAVAGWAEFDRIKEALLKTKLFNASEKIAHRLFYRPTGAQTGHPVDILPFRGVENPPRQIAWPPERTIVMNVIGYDEALASTVRVRIADELVIPVTSLAGLALLKLFAWQDRHADTSKDALDLILLMRNYVNAGNQDRIYDEEIALLESVNYDLDLAGPRLLGKDVRSIASPATLRAAETLLNDDRMLDRLLTQMAPAFNTAEDNWVRAEIALQQFKADLLK